MHSAKIADARIRYGKILEQMSSSRANPEARKPSRVKSPVAALLTNSRIRNVEVNGAVAYARVAKQLYHDLRKRRDRRPTVTKKLVAINVRRVVIRTGGSCLICGASPSPGGVYTRGARIPIPMNSRSEEIAHGGGPSPQRSRLVVPRGSIKPEKRMSNIPGFFFVLRDIISDTAY
jgi:hypothetical protein